MAILLGNLRVARECVKATNGCDGAALLAAVGNDAPLACHSLPIKGILVGAPWVRWFAL